jgi:hypothetical protein
MSDLKAINQPRESVNKLILKADHYNIFLPQFHGIDEAYNKRFLELCKKVKDLCEVAEPLIVAATPLSGAFGVEVHSVSNEGSSPVQRLCIIPRIVTPQGTFATYSKDEYFGILIEKGHKGHKNATEPLGDLYTFYHVKGDVRDMVKSEFLLNSVGKIPYLDGIQDIKTENYASFAKKVAALERFTKEVEQAREIAQTIVNRLDMILYADLTNYLESFGVAGYEFWNKALPPTAEEGGIQ